MNSVVLTVPNQVAHPRTAPNATESERGCVVLDQLRRVEKAGRIRFISMAAADEAAAAGLRHSRAPGQCRAAPESIRSGVYAFRHSSVLQIIRQ